MIQCQLFFAALFTATVEDINNKIPSDNFWVNGYQSNMVSHLLPNDKMYSLRPYFFAQSWKSNFLKENNGYT